MRYISLYNIDNGKGVSSSTEPSLLATEDDRGTRSNIDKPNRVNIYSVLLSFAPPKAMFFSA